MKSLLKSRKFLLLVLDTVIGLVTYFVGKYAGASSEDVLTAIGLLQPVFVALIIGIAVEDSAALKAGTHPTQR